LPDQTSEENRVEEMQKIEGQFGTQSGQKDPADRFYSAADHFVPDSNYKS